MLTGQIVYSDWLIMLAGLIVYSDWLIMLAGQIDYSDWLIMLAGLVVYLLADFDRNLARKLAKKRGNLFINQIIC